MPNRCSWRALRRVRRPYGNISLDAFQLCCASLDLKAHSFGRQLVCKLDSKPRAWESLSRCTSIAEVLGSTELLGSHSLTWSAGLHTLDTRRTHGLDATRDLIIPYFLSGDCHKRSDILCNLIVLTEEALRSTSRRWNLNHGFFDIFSNIQR